MEFIPFFKYGGAILIACVKDHEWKITGCNIFRKWDGRGRVTPPPLLEG
jgi:hypothetical protein